MKALTLIDKWAHEIVGTVATTAGAIAMMDPKIVTAALGPNAAAKVLLIGGAIQLAKSIYDKQRIRTMEIKP